MALLIEPWITFVVAVAGLINREQDKVVRYLLAENRIMQDKLKARGGRFRFTDDERRSLAVKARQLGRSGLRKLDTIVTPDTLLRWHRQLIAKKYDGSAKRRPGRPPVMAEIEALIVRMATENKWGYLRIQGALTNLGYQVARTTVANVLARHGIEPAPQRKTTWAEFLSSHWDVLAASDFFTVEIWSSSGLVRHHVLFFMELATRRVHIAGIVRDPCGAWIEQVARNLTDAFDGFLVGKRHLIMDRDPLFTRRYRDILRAAGVHSVRLPPRSPNLNPHAERFVLSIKSECLDRMIFFSESQLRRACDAYLSHYHTERNHQGIHNRLINGSPAANRDEEVRCSARLGGLLKYYHRNAA